MPTFNGNVTYNTANAVLLLLVGSAGIVKHVRLLSHASGLCGRRLVRDWHTALCNLHTSAALQYDDAACRINVIILAYGVNECTNALPHVCATGTSLHVWPAHIQVVCYNPWLHFFPVFAYACNTEV
jgi:hypothetical protein